MAATEMYDKAVMAMVFYFFMKGNKSSEPGKRRSEMSDNNLLRRLLIDEEGCKLEAYKDSEKKLWHIGIGHNLEMEQTDDELAVLGEFDEDDLGSVTITEQQAYTLFDIDVQDAIEDIYPFLTDEQLEALGETRRAVVLSMVFQIGGGSIRKFKNFKSAVLDERLGKSIIRNGNGQQRWSVSLAYSNARTMPTCCRCNADGLLREISS